MNSIKELGGKFQSGFLVNAKEFAICHKTAILISALVIVCGAMIINGIIQQPQILKNKQDIAALEEAIAYEDERVAEVERRSAIVGTDEYIEKVAREELGMVKEDEKLFVDISKE